MAAPEALPYPPPTSSAAHHPTEVRPVAARRILRPVSAAGRFLPCGDADLSINPYRGCAIGCAYCHARFTHAVVEIGAPDDFERRIYFKEGAPDLLRAELRRLAAAPGRARPPAVALGTLTDPYQPAEEQLQVTRGILRALLDGGPEGLDLRLSTKSDLVLRDLDLLTALGKRGPLRVNVTITTLDYDLARALEPRAPPPRRRLAALRALRDAGVPAGVLLMPLIPGVNDGEEAIAGLARESKAAGALYLTDEPLLLRPAAAVPFFRFLRRHSPQLERAYREAFDAGSRVPRSYCEKVRRRVAHARRELGLARSLPPRGREPRPRTARARQLEIPGI